MQNHTVYDLADPEEADAAKVSAIIARQNDVFRSTWGAHPSVPGQIVMTQGVAALPSPSQAALMVEVMTFDGFNGDNDPYGDHSFGKVTIENSGVETPLFWKIDLFDASYEYGPEASTDPTATRRVLTLMHPYEY